MDSTNTINYQPTAEKDIKLSLSVRTAAVFNHYDFFSKYEGSNSGHLVQTEFLLGKKLKNELDQKDSFFLRAGPVLSRSYYNGIDPIQRVGVLLGTEWISDTKKKFGFTGDFIFNRVSYQGVSYSGIEKGALLSVDSNLFRDWLRIGLFTGIYSYAAMPRFVGLKVQVDSPLF